MITSKSYLGKDLLCLMAISVGGCGCTESDHRLPGPKSQQGSGGNVVILSWEEAYVKYREQPADLRIIQRVREIAQGMPSDEGAQMACAVVERNSGNGAEAEAIFARIIDRNPNCAGALWNLGRLALQRGELDMASDFFAKSIKANPQAWQPLYALGQVRQQQGDMVAAKELFAQAKRLGAGKTDRFGGMDAIKPVTGMVRDLLEWD